VSNILNLDTIEKKWNHYIALYAAIQQGSSQAILVEFESLTQELESLVGLPPKSDVISILSLVQSAIEKKQESQRLQDHRTWLDKFDLQHRKSWEDLLNANPEGAKCEVLVRRLLEENGNQAEPACDLTGTRPTPDFRCTQGDQVFFVEVTCLGTDRVTKATGLASNEHSMKVGAFGDLNGVIFAACRKETPQCAYLGYPALIAVGTFHRLASQICLHQGLLQDLLTGTPYVTCRANSIDASYVSTKLERSTFIRSNMSTGEIEHARSLVSGILVCGFGCDPAEIRGVLHPDPAHEFDRKLLAKISFGRLRAGYSAGLLTPEWIGPIGKG
jgi:hypothetical protein